MGMTRDAAMNYLVAGKATLTLKSTVTGQHYTYRVEAKPDSDTTFFVNVLGGTGYIYLGLFDASEGKLILTKGSRFRDNDSCAQAFRFLLRCLFVEQRIPSSLEVDHLGTCGKCNRELTNPESLATGIGPECSKRARGRLVAA